jgi:hypothetical protein
LTAEAWVRPDGLRKGENATIIGKGRTDPKAANPSNQNWALRLRVLYDTACLNFLFASPAEKGVKWHRWTTPTGFPDDGRWHHVAVRYEFGKPEQPRLDRRQGDQGLMGHGRRDHRRADRRRRAGLDRLLAGRIAQQQLPRRDRRDPPPSHARAPPPSAPTASRRRFPGREDRDRRRCGPSLNAGNDSANAAKAAKVPEIPRKAPQHRLDHRHERTGARRALRSLEPTTNVWP